MLSYTVSPACLLPHVPAGTELEHWEGTALVSLIAFSFLNTKVAGVPIPFHRSFEQINLRFYVRRERPEGWRRGAVFLREVVPRRAMASIARWLYNESFVACPTRSAQVAEDGDRRVEYGWRHAGKWLTVGATRTGDPVLPGAGSAEELITERYCGYSSQRDGGTLEYRLEHPQWRVWPTSAHVTDGDFRAFYGPELGAALASSAPTSALIAEGSPVQLHRGQRLELPV